MIRQHYAPPTPPSGFRSKARPRDYARSAKKTVSPRSWPILVGQHEEFFAGCAAVSEKIGFVLDWMGFAADQSHQAATALAKKGRQVFGVLGFDIFHAATLGPARPASIRFLLPKSTSTSVLARTGALALPEPFALTRAFTPIGALEPFQTMTVKVLFDNLLIIEQITHIKYVMRALSWLMSRIAVNGCRSCCQAMN